MQKGFTKLFNTIVTSTIWSEDDKTRIVWITMLAIADKFGEVSASIPGLADVARVEVESCRHAIKRLSSDDPDSRTQDYGGKRIEVIDGGWRILNYLKYRKMLDEESRKEYKARWIRENRSLQKSTVDKSRQCRHNAESDSRVQKQKEEEPPNPLKRGKPRSKAQPLTSEELIKSFEADPTYARLNIREEFGKMSAWCAVRGVTSSSRRFVNWLNKALNDAPLRVMPRNGTYLSPKSGPEETVEQRREREQRRESQHNAQVDAEQERINEVQRQKVKVLAQELREKFRMP